MKTVALGMLIAWGTCASAGHGAPLPEETAVIQRAARKGEAVLTRRAVFFVERIESIVIALVVEYPLTGSYADLVRRVEAIKYENKVWMPMPGDIIDATGSFEKKSLNGKLVRYLQAASIQVTQQINPATTGLTVLANAFSEKERKRLREIAFAPRVTGGMNEQR